MATERGLAEEGRSALQDLFGLVPNIDRKQATEYERILRLALNALDEAVRYALSVDASTSAFSKSMYRAAGEARVIAMGELTVPAGGAKTGSAHNARAIGDESVS